jgi:hypothetical protein
MIALLFVALFAPGGPTCNAAELAKVDNAIKNVRADKQHIIALVGTAEACTLPAGLKAGVQAIQSAPPDRRAMLVEKSISESIPQWVGACPGGIDVFQRLATMAPATRVLHAFKACKVDRFGVKMSDLGTPPQLSLMGLMIAQHVRSFDPKASPRLIKALLHEQ